MGTAISEVGEEASKGNDYHFCVSTSMQKENETAAEEVRNVEAESGTEETTLEDSMKDVMMSEGVKNPKKKDYPFYASTVMEKENETTAEEQRKVEADIGKEETMLAENDKDFPTSEGVKKTRTVWDLITDGKY